MAAEQVAEQIAEGFEEAAKVTRRVDVKSVGFFVGGFGVGVAIGFFFGYRWNKEKIKAEAYRDADTEIASIREVFRQRQIVSEQQQKKPDLKDVVEDLGYSTGVDNEGNDIPRERLLRPPVPVSEPDISHVHSIVVPDGPNSFVKRTEEAYTDKNDGWSYPYELSRRSPNHPYIIHQDEFATNETGYSQVTYIYYEEDDVLTDTDDTVIDHRENLIGTDGFRWGHGTDDMNIVHIRNSILEIEFEICRTPRSFAQEVLGLAQNVSDDEEN